MLTGSMRIIITAFIVLAGNHRTLGRDVIPPTIICPDDIMISSPQSFVQMTWNPPTAEDNSGQTPTVTCSNNRRNDGVVLSNPSELLVSCNATDASGNVASCSFKVTVKVPECPNYVLPVNGALVCLEDPDTQWKKVCMSVCNDQYDFASKPALVYVCTNQRRWLVWPGAILDPESDRLPWPDCTKQSPSSKKSSPHPEYYYSGDAKDPTVKQKIKSNFVSAVRTIFTLSLFCPPTKLTIDNVNVYPGKIVSISSKKNIL